MLLISLILGIYWGLSFEGVSIWYDSKVIGSLVLLVGYFIYIYAQRVNKISMSKLMDTNIILFLILLINYIVVSRFSGFHQLFY